jgi:HAD superfamily hydrolase (TIGR01490 family)
MRRTKCLFCDVDGTLIRWQLFYLLIVGLVDQGLFPQVVLTRMEETLERYRNREGSFGDFIDAALKAYQEERRMRGIRVSDLSVVARKVIAEQGKRVHVFTRELISAAKENGYMTAFISGSPTEAVGELARFYGIDAWIGTDHPHEDGFYTGEPPKEWVRNKEEAVRKLQHTYNIVLKHSIAIGDSEGDIPMLKMVGYPIAFNPNKQLFEAARERCWPTVIEKKLVFPHRFNKRGVNVYANLWDFLPEGIANLVAIRIGSLGLGS